MCVCEYVVDKLPLAPITLFTTVLCTKTGATPRRSLSVGRAFETRYAKVQVRVLLRIEGCGFARRGRARWVKRRLRWWRC